MLKPRNILIVTTLMIVIYVDPFGLVTTLDPLLRSAWLLSVWIIAAIWIITLGARRRGRSDAAIGSDARNDRTDGESHIE